MVPELIKVENSMTVEEFNELFHALFPYLTSELSKNGTPIGNRIPFLKLAKDKEFCCFEIHEEMSVEDIQQLFKGTFDLDLSVFRKLGRSSVETSFTSKWTLKYQNEMGAKNYFDLEK